MGLKVKFSIERNGETQYMEHYFRENEPHVFNRHDEDRIKIEFDRFVERMKGEIEFWSVKGSGWVIERIMVAYVNVARYQPLRGGTYLPLPANLATKKAIINVQNRDNECLKWALRAALFPLQDGKNPQRPSKLVDPVRKLKIGEPSTLLTNFDIKGKAFEKVRLHNSRDIVTLQQVNILTV